MEQSYLKESIVQLLAAKTLKEQTAIAADEAKRDFERRKAEVIGMMVEHAEALQLKDPSDFSLEVNGQRIKATMKDYYSIKVADRECGFPALRAAGLGDLIQERLDDRTLTKALETEIANNGGALPLKFDAVPLSVYSKPDLSIRKA